MGEKDNKISTIELKVDLECQRCYKKIRKAICKIQDKMNIKTISYDEKKNLVTISGPFDAEKVCRKLCCQAGRVIKDMNIKGKEAKADGGEKAAGKPADKDAGKADKPKEGKADKEAGKAEKDAGKAEKPKEAKGGEKEAKPDKAEKGGKDDKKKVTFAEGDAKPAAEAKPAKAIPQADLGPLLEKIMAAKGAAAAAEAPCGEPIKPAMAPAAAQGVAVPSIWPAPAASMAGYSYNPSYDPSYYGGGGGYGYGGGYGGCGCGYAPGYCRCGKPTGGYYGVPVYDNQGWYYGGGGRQPYYAQQQPCCEDPNAGQCSVM